MKKIASLLLMSMTIFCGFAQEIKVKSITYLENDLEARRNQVLDNNGTPCAFIRIIVPMVKGMEFTGVKGEVKYQSGEYDAYIPEGTKRIKFRHENYEAGTIEFSMPIEKLCVYQVVLDVPNLGNSYEDLAAKAREYYANYKSHMESSYYDAARIAYNNAIEHNDCPADVRDTLRIEHDIMAFLRKNTYLIEAADAKVKQYEAEKGFNSDEVYKYLKGEIGFIDRILESHPEVAGFQTLKDELIKRLNEWERNKTLSGKISFKNPYMAIPFENMKVYASPTEKIQSTQSKMIGSVKADGTYSITKPSNMSTLYIYVSGEKDKAHYVASDVTTLDIIVK